MFLEFMSTSILFYDLIIQLYLFLYLSYLFIILFFNLNFIHYAPSVQRIFGQTCYSLFGVRIADWAAILHAAVIAAVAMCRVRNPACTATEHLERGTL